MIRGLYGIADAGVHPDPVELCDAMLTGGCRIIQLRAKHWSPAEILAAARSMKPRIRAAGGLFIINDHAEIAAQVGADGVHVGQLDAPTADVRALIGPDRILGRSTHDPEQLLLAAREADYVAFGPVFETGNVSRPKGVRGVEALAQARARLPAEVPLVAIGGITPARLGAVREAGADAWAVIGAIAAADDPVAATRALLP